MIRVVITGAKLQGTTAIIGVVVMIIIKTALMTIKIISLIKKSFGLFMIDDDDGDVSNYHY